MGGCNKPDAKTYDLNFVASQGSLWENKGRLQHTRRHALCFGMTAGKTGSLPWLYFKQVFVSPL